VVLGPKSPAPPPLVARDAPHGRMAWTDGNGYLTVQAPSQAIGTYPGMGWTVVARQPVETAFASADRLRHRIWLFGLTGALVFGVCGWWLAGRLTEPLRRVAAFARGMGTKDKQPQRTNEVDQLAHSLASLLVNLKRRERELETINESLELKVQERTASLRTANEDLRQFSRSVSHDVRGPLGSISLLMRQALARPGEPVPEHAKRAMHLVADEADRLHSMAEELLTLAMVEERELVTSPVDTEQMVKDVLAEIYRTSPRAPSVTVERLPTVAADPVTLRQVWTNLLSNAVKFSSKVKDPRISIACHQEGQETVFTVADNGAGFDSAQAARLFGVFQRLHASSQFPGTGVGLSIVKRVVHRHGGRVWAESRPGDGARFHFSLPLHPEAVHLAA